MAVDVPGDRAAVAEPGAVAVPGERGCAAAVLMLLALPLFGAVPPVPLQVVATASSVVFVGAARGLDVRRAAAEAGEASRAEDVVTLSARDVWQFPFIGSAFLLTMYFAIKIFGKDVINVLLVGYFSTLGAFAVEATLENELLPCLGVAAGAGVKYGRVFELPRVVAYCAGQASVDARNTAAQLLCWAAAVLTCAAYVCTKFWALNNILGICFCVSGIEMVSLGSFRNGAVLLCGLFVYDVTWVFGSDVMVTVAKGIDGPIKLLFPRRHVAGAETDKAKFSMLGLGDIVVPGLFIALLLRFDARRRLQHWPYFRAGMAGYVLGLATTLAVMYKFDAAQPALLYLVPAVLGASLLVAAKRNEVRLLLAFEEDESAGAAAAKAD
ncbi:signal peptide peptidase-domain-containing protein [Pelagophyceae sp. CCMP2097]|nr:signal peptide peptidase-domain-containing protein [Pelagophyceae sp. CCMP2097]